MYEGGLQKVLDFNEFDKARFIRKNENKLRLHNYSLHERNSLVELIAFSYDTIEADILRQYDNYRKKNQRARQKIESIIQSGNALFLTLTFTNDVLASTISKTRKTYVSRFLKQNCIEYIANIDFGSKNGREHYHAVVSVENKLDYSKWKFGALNGLKIRFNSKAIAMAKYINKLSNHATKSTTKNSRLIYSRSNH